jgi:hypothetical protein
MLRTDYCPELPIGPWNKYLQYDDLVHFLLPRKRLHVVSATLCPHCRSSCIHGQSVTPLCMQDGVQATIQHMLACVVQIDASSCPRLTEYLVDLSLKVLYTRAVVKEDPKLLVSSVVVASHSFSHHGSTSSKVPSRLPPS